MLQPSRPKLLQLGFVSVPAVLGSPSSDWTFLSQHAPSMESSVSAK